MKKAINLYLEFLASEYEYSEETIEEIKEEILNNFNEEHGLLSVSYTHLTLPTILRV